MQTTISIIDLTLTTGGIELNWLITGDEHHTGSDHAFIGWEILGLGKQGYKWVEYGRCGGERRKRSGRNGKGEGGRAGRKGGADTGGARQ